jgi:hypothetical protein
VESNKNGADLNTWRARVVRYLREWPARHGRSVQDQVWRGAAYGVGSGAVSVIVVWFESRF